jgi:hypothetical protein
MAPTIDPDVARKVLLETIAVSSHRGTHHFQRNAVIHQTCEKLGIRQYEDEQVHVFDAWDDLYRAGVVSYGYNLSNPDPPFARLTRGGVGAVASLSRDPTNSAGYRQTIGPHLKGRDIAESYLVEALETFNRGCVKAAAVMLGCAAESLNLDLRDRLRAKLSKNGPVPPNLDDWRIATVLRAMADELGKRDKDMPRELRERFEAHWPSWSGLFRMARNEAGHPSSVEPVTHEQVHAALLMFHEQARLCWDLRAWIDSSF